MKRIPVEEITDGMLLERDVCGPSGNILLSKGTTVNAAMGRRLKNWNIHQVFVQGEEETSGNAKAETIAPDVLKAQLEKKFSLVIANASMKKIFNAVYQFRILHG